MNLILSWYLRIFARMLNGENNQNEYMKRSSVKEMIFAWVGWGSGCKLSRDQEEILKIIKGKRERKINLKKEEETKRIKGEEKNRQLCCEKSKRKQEIVIKVKSGQRKQKGGKITRERKRKLCEAKNKSNEDTS